MDRKTKSLAYIYSKRLYRKIKRYMRPKEMWPNNSALVVRTLIEKEFDNYLVELCGRPE